METERFGFLDDLGRPLYLAFHGATTPVRGTVLMCGALAIEATHSALVWNRWARQLAAAGWNAIRFDWRGSGESSGAFEDVTFDDWKEDVERICRALRLADHNPLVILGLRGGTLPAAHAFANNWGDGLILWEPPATGQAHLMEVLRRKLAEDYAVAVDSTRKTRDDYVAEIMQGGQVEVEGFPWTKPYWQSFCPVALPKLDDIRPHRTLSLRTHRIQRPVFWQDVMNFRPDISEWTQASLSFLAEIAQTASTNPAALPISDVATIGDIERQILTLQQDGGNLVVTHHVPRQPRQLGMVMPNFGYVPRCGHGAIAARICDELAGLGIDAFRVDLPALGDSDGELPANTEAWASAVRAGSMTTVMVSAIEQLRRRFCLTDVILGGLCAASITALYAFQMRPKLVSALILLEPELFGFASASQHVTLEEQSTVARPQGGSLQRLRSTVKGLFSDWGWMRLIAGENDLMRRLPIPRPLALKLLSLVSQKLPGRTNLPLIAAWQLAIRSRTPMLVVTAEGKMRELFFDRVNSVVVPDYASLSSPGKAITHVRIPNTNHTFTAGGAIKKVTAVVVDWARGQLPVDQASVSDFRRAAMHATNAPEDS